MIYKGRLYNNRNKPTTTMIPMPIETNIKSKIADKTPPLNCSTCCDIMSNAGSANEIKNPIVNPNRIIYRCLFSFAIVGPSNCPIGFIPKSTPKRNSVSPKIRSIVLNINLRYKWLDNGYIKKCVKLTITKTGQIDKKTSLSFCVKIFNRYLFLILDISIIP